MKAWQTDQKCDDTMISMYGDPAGEFTKALGMEMTHEGPASVGIIGRCKRHAMYCDDGVVKSFHLAEDPEHDPAGDEFPEETLAPALLEAISSLSD
mmetsp:Transcript_26158/g.39591  ORF Transcript_26158/g.39591 Transcript_26158/m.39591 type:complete len:96 (+) Transcript_26158:261-548(+)